MAELEQNKHTARAFVELVLNDKRPAEAVAKYVGATYIQHDPQAPDGIAGFVRFLTEFLAQFPQLTVEIKRMAADGDLVVVHSRMTTSPRDPGSALVDIFRFDDGKIVEHWDVIQPVPETAANDNTMF
ncbi:MAG: nuclear transport factor 2 family protein [Kutzneria sp.]|nr:nuclear transport factor 2 family protein [Kutzneria sp.]